MSHAFLWLLNDDVIQCYGPRSQTLRHDSGNVCERIYYNGGGSYVVCVVSVGVVDDRLSDGSDNEGIEGTDNGGRPRLTN